MATQYNRKSAGVKRLMKEAAELCEPTEMYFAQPLDDNLFEWHFTVRGPLDSDFDGGIYHGRIVFPAEYPMKPPNLIILTPNGRFELNKKICLSISGFHPETWLPSWSIRTALLALIGFMPTAGGGALGSLEYPSSERKKLAKRSVDWKCKECGIFMREALKPLSENARKSNMEARNLAAQLSFKGDSEDKNFNDQSRDDRSQHPNPDLNNSSVISVSSNATLDLVETSNSQEICHTTPDQVQSASITSPSTVSNMQSPVMNHRNQSSSNDSYDIYIFIVVPISFVFIGIFIILLARRLLA